MFSTSTMASSTMAPRAITKPASTIVLMVVPRAVEHQPGRDQRHRDGDDADQRAAPVEQEQRQDDHDQQRAEHQRLAEVVRAPPRTKVAGRKMVVSMSKPGEPGPHLVDGGLDALRDVERVAPRELLDDHHETRAAVDDRVADERLVVLRRRVATSPMRMDSPPRLADDDLGQLGGLERSAGRGGRRAVGSAVSMKPPLPTTEPLVYLRMPASRASPVDSMTSSSVMPFASSSCGADLDDLHVDALAPDRPRWPRRAPAAGGPGSSSTRSSTGRSPRRPSTRCRSSSPGWSTRAAAA